MNKQRLAILIASGIGALATFMPWVKAPIVGTISGVQGDGWFTLVLFAVPIVLSLMNDKTKKIEGSKLYCAVIPPVIAALVGIWKIIDFNSKMGDIGDNPFAQALGASVSIEFGLYLMVLAGIATPVLAFLIKDQTEE